MIIQGLLVLMLAGCFPMGFIRARSKTARGHQNNHRHGDLSGDGNGPRLSWDVGPCRANSQGPWPGRAGMWSWRSALLWLCWDRQPWGAELRTWDVSSRWGALEGLGRDSQGW